MCYDDMNMKVHLSLDVCVCTYQSRMSKALIFSLLAKMTTVDAARAPPNSVASFFINEQFFKYT